MGLLLDFWPVLVALAGAAALYFKGRSDGGRKAEKRRTDAALDTHGRIDDADTGSGDPDADRDWLHKRGQR